MEDRLYTLPLGAAKECLAFAKRLGSDDMYSKLVEAGQDKGTVDRFKNDLNGFIDFMTISVNSELHVITVPKRYHSIYSAVGQTGMLALLLGL